MNGPRVPIATYRLQLNRHFRFKDTQAIVSYLDKLGITDFYISPIFKARSGSLHGYDVIDPTRLNPELGTEQDFEALVKTLKARGMGLLLDIVPNHLAASTENPWWLDLMEHGPNSPYAGFFDLKWDPNCSPIVRRILLPVLGTPYGEALERQALSLTLEELGVFVRYGDLKLPVEVRSYGLLLSYRMKELKTRLGPRHPALTQLHRLLSDLENFPLIPKLEVQNPLERGKKARRLKEKFLDLIKAWPEVRTFFLENIAKYNGKKGDPRSFDLLGNLLASQHYRLAFWQVSREELNYRRFFDINDLVGLRLEDPKVLEATHTLVNRLVHENKVTGLRIDHIDGLYDPTNYLNYLRLSLNSNKKAKGVGTFFYIIVEKILAPKEDLPSDWPIHGTTGYDFLNSLNNLFINIEGFQTLHSIYKKIIREKTGFSDEMHKKKMQVINELFTGELRRLVYSIYQMAVKDRHACDIPRNMLTRALTAVTICLPVYRTYTNTPRVSSRDRAYLETAVQEARRYDPSIDPRALEFVRRVILLDFPESLNPEGRSKWLHFVMQWQQFTTSVTAKGVEDTAFYTYNPLISINEVGGGVDDEGFSIESFHQKNLTRQASWPYSLNATSTHDTKRSEDVRARLNVLSEIPEMWEEHSTRWRRWNYNKKRLVRGQLVPDDNFELLLYQTLLGAWPLFGEEVLAFKERLKSYAVKAAREAKEITSWMSPDYEYEGALLAFLDTILEHSRENKFLQDFLWLQGRVAYYGALNSLAQVLLKTTVPGVPDFYQGTELWDFSLVDPDNRRPVDFEKRRNILDALVKGEVQKERRLLRQLLSTWQDGRVKLYMTHKTLNVRRTYRYLFLEGEYIPLRVKGQKLKYVCAFARRKDGRWAIVATPRFFSKLTPLGRPPIGRSVWKSETLLLPKDAPEEWLNHLTGETLTTPFKEGGMPLSQIFATTPYALLTNI